MVYRNWDKKTQSDQQALLRRAEEVLENIENL
jgi:deoxyribodipyrimidine photolyase-like uncharacterized protein